jgi:hypothetical protein
MTEEDALTKEHRDAIVQRVRVGLTGLAAVFLLTLLAASIFGLLGQDEQHAQKLANGAVVANGASPDDPPKEPLAELGVAPGANMPKATVTQQPGKPPIVTIAPPAPVLNAAGQPAAAQPKPAPAP